MGIRTFKLRKRVSVKLEVVASEIWSSPLKIKLYPCPASHSPSFIYLDHGGSGRAPGALAPPPSSPWRSAIKGLRSLHHLTISCTITQYYPSPPHWLINLVRYQNTSRNSNFIIISYLMDIVTQCNVLQWLMNILTWDEFCWKFSQDFDLVRIC